MPCELLEHLQQDAASAVRNLPDAHAPWQFWRNTAFRRAISRVVAAVYALDIETLTDEHLQALERLVRAVIHLVDVHAAGLGGGVRDTVDREHFRKIIEQLREALEGLEQGLAPDPRKRPSDDELMNQFAVGLRQARTI